MISKLQVNRAALSDTLRYLQQSGRLNSEGVVLWLGQRTVERSLVTRVYQPIHRASADFFHIPKEGMAHLMHYMDEHKVSVVAQVHSHPHQAFHSAADDKWAIVRHLGALSLVLPDFARDTTYQNFSDLAATFRLDAKNHWIRVEQQELVKYLEVIL